MSKPNQHQYANRTKVVLMDFAIVYLFVPLWLSLFASALKDSREKHLWMQSFNFIGDLMLQVMVLVLVGFPLTYLRLQASNPSHFLHRFRVQTTETFMEETRVRPAPNPFSLDSIFFVVTIVCYSVSNLFDERSLSDIGLFSLYSQSFGEITSSPFSMDISIFNFLLCSYI